MDSREGSFNRTFAEVVASAAQGSSSGPSQICAPKSAAYVPPHLRGKEKGMQKKAKAENLAAAGGPQQSGKKFVPVSAITHPTNRTAPYINTDKKPSEEKQMPFLYQGDDALIRKYGNYDTEETGKWMMFFAKGAELDERWAQAKQLYNEGKLDGVTSMKVSTAYENPRASNKGKGVIIFYCGPFSDKPKMVEIGQNLLAHIPYNEPMAYKSDEQTLQGTRATGIKKNHLYTTNNRPFSAAGHKNFGE